MSWKCSICTTSYEAQEAMDQHYKAKWQQAEADLTALCQSNSAQVQSFASKMHETNEEHQKLYTCTRETDTTRGTSSSRSTSIWTTSSADSPGISGHDTELRRQADEQPDLQKLLWKFLSRQTTAQRSMSSIPNCSMWKRSLRWSRTWLRTCAELIIQCQAGPWSLSQQNVLNTLSPGRSQRWILPHELETPHQTNIVGPTVTSGSPSPARSKSTDEGIYPTSSMPYSTSAMERKFMVEQEMTNVNCLAAYS